MPSNKWEEAVDTAVFNYEVELSSIEDKLRRRVLIPQEAEKRISEQQEELKLALTNAVRELTKETMPKKHNRKTDVEYGYCVTCNQNIDSAESDCFCTIHNLAIDTYQANLLKAIGDKS